MISRIFLIGLLVNIMVISLVVIFSNLNEPGEEKKQLTAQLINSIKQDYTEYENWNLGIEQIIAHSLSGTDPVPSESYDYEIKPRLCFGPKSVFTNICQLRQRQIELLKFSRYTGLPVQLMVNSLNEEIHFNNQIIDLSLSSYQEIDLLVDETVNEVLDRNYFIRRFNLDPLKQRPVEIFSTEKI